MFRISGAFGQENPLVTDGYQVFYHANGVISSEGTMRAGKPDGYWKTYNEQGILISEGNRKNYELDSTWRFYDAEGKIAMEIGYRNGKKDGIRKTFRPDEIIEENFREDVKNGPTRYYALPSGKMTREVTFRDGLEEGLAREFDLSGNIITLITYKSGFIVERELINRYDNNGLQHGQWKYFWDNGLVKREGSYKHGKENGFFKEYDRDGNLLTTAKYLEGARQEDVAELARLDMRKDYYPDGKIRIAATYNKEGKPEGVRREYAPDGSIERSYIFRNGILIGEGIVTEKGERDGYWKEYYDDGKLRAEGKYIRDVKDGPWIYYHANGMTEQEGKYSEGKPEGEWLWFYPSGELLREESYFNGLADGIMTEYDESGAVITKGEFIEGREEGAWIYRAGDAQIEGVYSGGLRNGLWTYSDLPREPGKPMVKRFEGRFIEDNPHGKHTYYWSNGNRKEEGEYNMGRKTGDWVYYQDDGLPFIVISYENGVEVRYDGIRIAENRPDPEQ